MTLETMTIKQKSANLLRVYQKAIECSMLGSLTDRIKNDEIRRTGVSETSGKTSDVMETVEKNKCFYP